MKIFQVNSFGAAVILTFLVMGFLGLFVLMPVVLIQWTWNSVAQGLSVAPAINMWQASLLYIACALVLYIIGVVEIDVGVDRVE
jgi:predicted membrane channel-forming protein YqfA (hemolysin III family)